MMIKPVNWIGRQSAFGEQRILAMSNTPASITKEIVHRRWDVSDVLEHVIHLEARVKVTVSKFNEITDHFLELNETPRANLGHFVHVLPIGAGNVEKGTGIFTLDFVDFEGIVQCWFIVASVTIMTH